MQQAELIQIDMRVSVASRQRAMLAAFALTLFGSAFLLFSVQPMVSRMVLPRLGGSPAVWNTCVLFFQASLLAGYAYADWSVARLRPRRQLALHALVLLGGIAMLPLSIGQGAPPPDGLPAIWLLGRLLLTIGPPFAAISATAPLLQSWFGRTSHPSAADPYFLYSASNAGSLLALLSYPVLIETTMGLHMQTLIWSTAFLAVAAAIVGCGVIAVRSMPELAARQSAPAAAGAAPALPWRIQARWIALAFVPSGLMLAVTTYITTDVAAAAPLFWVIPLAIYIATFMLAFGRRARSAPGWLGLAQAMALAAAAGATLFRAATLGALGVSLGIALLAFTLTAAACHYQLARERPDPRHLTRYFLLISIGGALGGLMNGMLAPMLFRGPWEYPLLLLAAAGLHALYQPAAPAPAAVASEGKLGALRLLRPLLLLGGGVALVLAGGPRAPEWIRAPGEILRLTIPAALLVWALRGKYLRAGVAALLVVGLAARAYHVQESARSFFGTYRVLDMPQFGLTGLEHGTTLHGVQDTRPDQAKVPLGYYYREGPFGRLFEALDKHSAAPRSVGIIGLGTGAMACFAHPGDTLDFREIDPEMERLARDDRFFHFLHQCGNQPKVILGDARVTLGADTAARYDVIVIDAFTSDSVPLHLLTREALALYFSRLKPGGLVVFHVSNRYLDLVPVVARLGQDAGAAVRHLFLPQANPPRTLATEVVAMAPPGGNLDFLLDDGWDVPKPASVLWTDDRSDIYSVIR